MNALARSENDSERDLSSSLTDDMTDESREQTTTHFLELVLYIVLRSEQTNLRQARTVMR